MKVTCSIEECSLTDGKGRAVDGVCARCTRCGHEATAYGTDGPSIRRALMTLRDECPEDESNFYAAEDDDDGAESPMPKSPVAPW